MPVAWDPTTYARLAKAEEIQVTLRDDPDSPPARPVTIWVVAVAHDLYVRAAYGPDSAWGARARRQPSGRIRTAGLDVAVTFEPAAPSRAPAISAAYEAKYGGRYPRSILEPMVGQRAASVAFRVLPQATGGGQAAR